MAMLEVRDLRKSFYTYAKPGLQAGIFHKPGARKVVSQLDVLKGVDLTVNKGDVVRSEERRVGKECRSRWSPYH